MAFWIQVPLVKNNLMSLKFCSDALFHLAFFFFFYFRIIFYFVKQLKTLAEGSEPQTSPCVPAVSLARTQTDMMLDTA